MGCWMFFFFLINLFGTEGNVKIQEISFNLLLDV